MIAAYFLAFPYQDRDERIVARPELLISVDVHDIETKRKPRLEFLQRGYHFVTKMTMLATVKGKRNGACPHIICCLCCRHSFSS